MLCGLYISQNYPNYQNPVKFHYVSGYKFNTQKLPFFLCLEIARLFRLFDMRTRKLSDMRAVYGCKLDVVGF